MQRRIDGQEGREGEKEKGRRRNEEGEREKEKGRRRKGEGERDIDYVVYNRTSLFWGWQIHGVQSTEAKFLDGGGGSITGIE
jgi:hypothetical protein